MANLILKQNYLIDRSIIDENINYKKIVPIIELVQDLYIQPLLGSNLYDEILTQSTPDNPAASPLVYSNLTAANATLLNDHILKIMVLYVLAEAPAAIHYRYMNKGIMIKSSENSQPAGEDVLKELFDSWKNKAELYADRMKKYILANPGLYPAYFNNSGIDQEQPRGAFNVDFHLPERNNNSESYYYNKTWIDRGF